MPSGIPALSIYSLQEAKSDGAEAVVYFCGTIKLDTAPWQETNPVLSYSDGQWDTLGAFNDIVCSTALLNDTLFVGGGFTEAQGVAVSNIAYLAPDGWHAAGSTNAVVRKLRVLDGRLYAMGGFSYADGQLCNGIARWTGNGWEPIGPPSLSAGPMIVDACIYQGELVMVGSFTLTGGGGRIAKYDGTQWQQLGPGIPGGFSNARCVATYGNDLYVGGQIYTGAGNAGQNIMRWDGTQFNEVGGSLWYAYGSQTTTTVFTLVVHDSLLYAGGGFLYAGPMPVEGLAAWDGVKWCRVPGPIKTDAGGVYGIGFVGDTLFLATDGDTLEGQFINNVPRTIGAVQFDTCSAPMAVPELGVEQFTLHPNPASTELNITPRPGPGADAVLLTDPLGRVVLQQNLNGATTSLAVQGLAPGPYMAVLLDATGNRIGAVRWVKE